MGPRAKELCIQNLGIGSHEDLALEDRIAPQRYPLDNYQS